MSKIQMILNKDSQKTKTASYTKSEILPTDNSKSSLEKKSTPSIRYILEGAIIKVYVTDEKGNTRCVQNIPLQAATLAILAKVECTSFQDSMLLEDIKRKKTEPDNSLIAYDKTGKSNDPEY